MSKKIPMLKVTVSIALAVILCLGLVSAAVSAPDPAQAALTKILKMGVGTDTPEAKFIFTFTPQNVDGEAYVYNNVTNEGNMPGLGPVEIEFDGTEVDAAPAGGVKTLWKESEDFVDGITWPHAGEYTYELVETAGTYPNADNVTEWMTYSKALYEVVVVVENGDLPGTYYVAHVFVTRLYDDDGEEIIDGEKVISEPGGGVDYDYSQVTFTNIYAKTNGGGVDDPDITVLDLSKAVDGLGADKSKYFDFSVALKNVALDFENKPTSYLAYVVDTDGSFVSAANIGANAGAGATTGSDANGGGTITFPAGAVDATVTNIKLKDGQKLVFVDLLVGAEYKITEAGVANYKAAYSQIVNGGAPATDANNDPATSLATSAKYIGEDENSVAFTNTRTGVTPTGIIVDNLPYIVMIALALLALVGYVAIRSRRNAPDNA